jgi:hypothetical protein
MAANDAMPEPIYGAKFRLYLPVLSTTGTIVTNLTGLAATRFQDGGTSGALATTPTEVGTTGFVAIDISDSESGCACLVGTVTATNTGAVPATFTLFPRRPHVASSGTVGASASTTAIPLSVASYLNDHYNGMLLMITSSSGSSAGEVRAITDYDETTNTATVAPAFSAAPAEGDGYSVIYQPSNSQVGGWAGSMVEKPTTAGRPSVRVAAFASGLLPTNFSSLSIDASGRVISLAVIGGVTVTTNNDKIGYSLTQAFPTNFAALSISTGGMVEANTIQLAGYGVPVSDLTEGYLRVDIAAIGSATLPHTGGKLHVLDGSGAALATSAQVVALPQSILIYDWTSVTGTVPRYSLLNSARIGCNKTDTNTTTNIVSVYAEDGTTVAFTLQLSTDATAAPIISIAPIA